MKLAAVSLAGMLGGCSQLLGLEDTKFEQRDAMVDAPSNCDAAPRCTSTSGRSACGQMIGALAQAGQLVRVEAPTGETCADLNLSTGPCAYGVYAQPLASYYAGETADRVAGEIDDCGRFFVLDLDTAEADIAVVFTGADIAESVTVVLDRVAMTGEDREIDAPLIPSTAATDWGIQVSASNPPTFTGGYLVTYVDMNGEPIAMQELRIDGGAVGDPPTVPWGAYFSGGAPYGMIDPAASATSASGSALVVPAASTFMLGGFRTGRNCAPVTLEPEPNAFIHLALSC